MNPEDSITNQLTEQGIEFEILQNEYDPNPDSPLTQVVQKWTEKFIANKTAPYLDNYLWHIFSYGAMKAIDGNKAEEELLKQYAADVVIFNEPQQYLIRCKKSLPIIKMDDFFDDVYISHHNMKWTFVIPHESPHIGPFFSTGN